MLEIGTFHHQTVVVLTVHQEFVLEELHIVVDELNKTLGLVARDLLVQRRDNTVRVKRVQSLEKFDQSINFPVGVILPQFRGVLLVVVIRVIAPLKYRRQDSSSLFGLVLVNGRMNTAVG